MISNSISQFKSRAKVAGKFTRQRLSTLTEKEQDPAKDYCYKSLDKVSRSFAVVIRQLSPELKDSVCVFYLVLRALDSIEDDLSVPLSDRIRLLHAFYKNVGNEDFALENIGDHPDYQELLSNYGFIAQTYNKLPESSREVIADITCRMGQGMAYYSQNKVETIYDYNEYCHYVAGLVGIGLSELFVATGIENKVLADEWQLSNAMGLFLQKTNITRDFAEDLDAGRFFWPAEIWGKYGTSPKSIQSNYRSEASLNCLNHMVVDALQHFESCISYLKNIQDPSVFRFCAIPQIMALATLKSLYNNSNVFIENVKIPKKESSRLFLDCNDYQSFLNLTDIYITQWIEQLKASDNPQVFPVLDSIRTIVNPSKK